MIDLLVAGVFGYALGSFVTVTIIAIAGRFFDDDSSV